MMDTTIKNIVIGLLVFSLLLGGFINFWGDMLNTYNKTNIASQFSSLDKAKNISSQYQSVETALEKGKSSTTYSVSLLQGGLQVVNTFLSLPSILFSLISDLANILANYGILVPATYIYGILAVVTAFIIITVLSVVLGRTV